MHIVLLYISVIEECEPAFQRCQMAVGCASGVQQKCGYVSVCKLVTRQVQFGHWQMRLMTAFCGCSACISIDFALKRS